MSSTYEVTIDVTITRTFEVTAESPVEAGQLAKEWAEDLGANGIPGRAEMYAKHSAIRVSGATARKLEA